MRGEKAVAGEAFDENAAFQETMEEELGSKSEYESKRRMELSAGGQEAIIAYEPDIFIGNNVGAKLKDTLVKLPNGEKVVLTRGKKITQVQTIAGAGRNRKIDEIPTLLSRYPGTKEELWKKRKGFGYVDYDGESYLADLHWYEEPTVGRVEYKVKPDAGGNWFYEEE